ncbi:MAG: hypothetical protein HUK25_02070 [Treponema sp.]|nr:hypothetical protein [Treponema sp.]
MNELFEGCDHNCDCCMGFDNCYFANMAKSEYIWAVEEREMFADSIREMMEENFWNKENCCFEKRFVCADARKYRRKSYLKGKKKCVSAVRIIQTYTP